MFDEFFPPAFPARKEQTPRKKPALPSVQRKRNANGTFACEHGEAMQQAKPKQPKRSKGHRLASNAGVAALLQDLRTSLIDRRTKTSIRFEALQAALEKAPKKVAAELLRQNVAILATITNAILQFAQQRQGLLVSAKGEILPLIKNDLPKFQNALSSNMNTLLKLNDSSFTDSKEDVADFVLSIAATDTGKEETKNS